MRLVKSSARAFSRPVRTVLDNGVQVVTQHTGQQAAVVGVVSKGGSRAESASSQATLNRSITLSAIAPQAGVQINSVLHRERTGVYGVTTADKAVSVASALVEAANVREVSDAARSHAQAALDASSQDLKTVISDYAHMAGFVQTPLSTSPLGSSAGISGTSNDDVLAYRDARYSGANAIVVGAGNVDHDALCEVASALPASDVPTFKGPNCQFTGSVMKDRNDYVRNCTVQWAWNVPGSDKPSQNAGFAVLAEMIGSWQKGDQHAQHSLASMTQWIANCNTNRRVSDGGHNSEYNLDKLNYYTGYLNTYSDTALFGFQAEVVDADSAGSSLIHNNRLQQITNLLQGSIKQWSHGFSDHEVAAAKNSLIVKLSNQLSNPLNLADQMAAEATIGGNSTAFAAKVHQITKVDASDLEKIFFDWIYNKEVAMVYYGATEGAPEGIQARNRNWDLLKW